MIRRLNGGPTASARIFGFASYPTPFHGHGLINHVTEALLDVGCARLPLRSDVLTRAPVAQQTPLQIEALP